MQKEKEGFSIDDTTFGFNWYWIYMQVSVVAMLVEISD